MEDIGRVVHLFPAFGQVRLEGEGARPHVGADFMPHQSAIDEAQRGMRPVADRKMRIEVRRVQPAHAQNTAALRRPGFGPPEHRGTMQRSEEHTSELQSLAYLVCRLLL